MASSPPRPQRTPLATSPAPANDNGLYPGDDALREVLAQLDVGEGACVGLLGDVGTGKTTAGQRLVDMYLERSPGSVLIIDDKEIRPRFAGNLRINREDLRARPLEGDELKCRVTIFRGEPSKGQLLTAEEIEEIAELCWKRAAHSRKTLLVVDELVSGREDLCKNQQWRKGITWLPRICTMGRSPGISLGWGAQSPQLVPIEPFEHANGILTFRLAGLGLETLRRRDYTLGGAEERIPRLHGPPDPPASRGDFALLARGRPWNGKTYKFAAP